MRLTIDSFFTVINTDLSKLVTPFGQLRWKISKMGTKKSKKEMKNFKNQSLIKYKWVIKNKKKRKL